MTPDEVDALLGPEADHRDAERRFLAEGWMPCGVGDWALALRSPDGELAVRISPFDPAGPYVAAIYREAAHTRQVPRLFVHRRLTGGGDLSVMEWLGAVPEAEAVAFHRAIAESAPKVAELAQVIRRVHERAQVELPWCGPIDVNPDNVMRAADGRLVIADLFSAAGPELYRTAVDDPALVAARIPEPERRFMAEIPLTSSGPWEPGAQEKLRAGLAAADAARSRS